MSPVSNKTWEGNQTGVDIFCYTGESGCAAAADQYGEAYDEVHIHIMNRMLDSIYDHYAANDMAGFYLRNLYDFRNAFPEIDRDRPGALDSLANGDYKIIITGDSSVLVVKTPLDSIGIDNIVFAIDRDARPIIK